MKSKFEIQSLKLSLEKLVESNTINNVQLNELFDIYSNDKRELKVIQKEINQIKNNPILLQSIIKKASNKVLDKTLDNVNLNKKTEIPLSLENITDFEKDGKSYIKIHYPLPSDKIKIVENMTDPYKSGKEQFLELKNNSNLTSLNGINNSTIIFEQNIENRCHDIKIKEIKELTSIEEYSKLNNEQKKMVYGTLKSIIATLNITEERKKQLSSMSIDLMLASLDKKIYIALDDNIVVSSIPGSMIEDEVKTLKTSKNIGENGEIISYTLSPVNEKGYESNAKEEDKDEHISEIEKQTESDIDKEIGSAYSIKQKKKRKQEAAFVNLTWLILFLSVIILTFIGIFFLKTYY